MNPERPHGGERHGWPAPVAVQQQHLRRRAGLEQASIVDDEQMDYLQTHDCGRRST